jgi:hypothetical protein
LATVRDSATGLAESDQRLVAALIDVLWGLPTFRRLIDDWGLDVGEAARSVGWLLDLLSEAVRTGNGPGSADDDRQRLPAANRRR